MRFKIGEKVRFLHERGEGIVLAYKNSHCAIVKDETEFEREIFVKNLVKIYGDPQCVLIPNHKDFKDVNPSVISDNFSIKGLTKTSKYWEIDLHSHVVLDTERGKRNGQILNYQLSVFKRCFEKCRDKHIRKLIVIHGVGEGVLKSEIWKYLEEKEGLEFSNADVRCYGYGATEVKLFYK